MRYQFDRGLLTSNVLLSGFLGWLGGNGADYDSQLSKAWDLYRSVAAREARRSNQKYAAKAIASAAYRMRSVFFMTLSSTALKSIGTTVANTLISQHIDYKEQVVFEGYSLKLTI